jgi:SAM-dependent methyltransferase
MKVISCPNCQANSSLFIWEHCRDRFLMRQRDERSIRFVVCQHCGLGYANPQLEGPEVKRLYTDYYRESGIGAGHLRFKEGQSHERIKWLMQHCGNNTPGRALEVGCSEGILLRQLRDDHGWVVSGIEPCSPYARHGIERFNLNISIGFFPEACRETHFDLILCIHVIEHIADPTRFLREMASVMKPNGHILLETPNLWKPNFRRISANLFAAPHLVIFSPRSMRFFLNQAGFEVVKLQADGNLRALARWKGSPGVVRSVPPPRNVWHGVGLVGFYRLMWLRERGYMSSLSAKAWLSRIGKRCLGLRKYDRLHRLLVGRK